MRTFSLIFMLSIASAVYAQKDHSYYLRWSKSPDQDLLSPDLKYTEKGKFYYSFSNDRDNIYITLKIFEPDVQRAIIRNGLSVWIDMNGKKDKKTGLRFPVNEGHQGFGSRPQGSQRPPQSGRREGETDNTQGNPGNMQQGREFSFGRPVQIPEAPKMEVIGLGGASREVISPVELNSFRGSVRMEKDGNMWYQLTIPLSKMPASENTKKKGDGSFILGFSYPVAAAPQMRGGAGGGFEGGMGGYGRGEGGYGGGGGRGGMRGGGGGMRNRMPGEGMGGGTPTTTTIVVWFKDLRLASQ